MQWGKLQVVQEPDRSKTTVIKKREKISCLDDS